MSEPTLAEANHWVEVEYIVKSDDGEVVDDGADPMRFVLGYGTVLPLIEEAILGLEVGGSKHVRVEPKDGFGDHDDELVFELDRSELPNPAEVHVGDAFEFEFPSGELDVVHVTRVEADHVVCDANHPLAGVTLTYDLRLKSVRAATDVEIEAAALERSLIEEAEEEEPLAAASNLVQLRTKSQAAGEGGGV